MRNIIHGRVSWDTLEIYIIQIKNPSTKEEPTSRRKISIVILSLGKSDLEHLLGCYDALESHTKHACIHVYLSKRGLCRSAPWLMNISESRVSAHHAIAEGGGTCGLRSSDGGGGEGTTCALNVFPAGGGGRYSLLHS